MVGREERKNLGLLTKDRGLKKLSGIRGYSTGDVECKKRLFQSAFFCVCVSISMYKCVLYIHMGIHICIHTQAHMYPCFSAPWIPVESRIPGGK